VLQARWPDVLEAVRNQRKVAWLLLINASVGSFDGTVVTVEFAREGDAKGFVAGGHDAALAQALNSVFGISPQVKAAVRSAQSPAAGRSGSGGGSGSAGEAASNGGASPSRGGWDDSPSGGSPSGTSQASAPQGGAASSGAAPSGANQASSAATAAAPQATDWDGPPPPDPADDADWDPRDEDSYASRPGLPPDPRLDGPQTARPGSAFGGRPGSAGAAGPTAAMDLIQRELGGRVIQDPSA
jgi:DNA polymerase-3 subunit gamma/tau